MRQGGVNGIITVFVDCIILPMLIGRLKFQYCPREVNEMAHELAQACIESSWGW
jgi:hypothetical protein